ncbi:MAG: GNAT family N-acetyltransferase [Bacillota bacterium]|nr:GNAT family N-acetyltransferase [Bacillota bacterium]
MVFWREITIDNLHYLEAVFPLYDLVFPPEVREPHFVFLSAIKKKECFFHYLVGVESDEIVSFATAHYLADVNTGFIVYIATNPSFRKKGIGTETLINIEKILKVESINAGHHDLRAIVVETEKLELAQNETQKEECLKRNLFFTKNKYSFYQAISYVQPPLHNEESPISLNLFIKSAQEGIPKEEVCNIISSIYLHKYHNINGIDMKTLINCFNMMNIQVGKETGG